MGSGGSLYGGSKRLHPVSADGANTAAANKNNNNNFFMKPTPGVNIL
jgi:hypothetical protein